MSSVKVYISDFGKKRLEEEETLGPHELRQKTSRPKSKPINFYSTKCRLLRKTGLGGFIKILRVAEFA